jgi:enoyl-CoA hydratase
MTDVIDIGAADGVTVLKLVRPPVNALDLRLLDELTAAMRAVEGPVVISGSGSCFSAGVDLRAILDGGREYTEAFLPSLITAFRAVFDHPGPVVAAVNGHAIAGGCVIAMAADARFMSGGTIGISEIAVGVPFPTVAIEICRYAMGRTATLAALGAESVPPDVAAARGWVDEVVEPAQLLDRAVTCAAELGAHSPSAYALTKAQLHAPAHAAIEAGAAQDAAAREAWLAETTRRRIAAFLAGLRG